MVTTPISRLILLQVLAQIPVENEKKKTESDGLYSKASKYTPINISPRMLSSILEVGNLPQQMVRHALRKLVESPSL